MRAFLVAALLLLLCPVALASHTDQESLPALETVRVTGHTPDVDGGPPWAVRSWRTVRAPRHGLAGGETCLQVGRVLDGRLVRTFAAGAPRQMNLRDRSICGVVSRSGVADAPLILERLVADPAAPSPRIARTIVAGLAPRHVRSIEILGAGPVRSPHIDPRTRTWLAVLPGGVRQAHLTLSYRLPNGTRDVDLRDGSTAPTDADRVEIVPGSVRRPLTVPDAGGGLPFGLVTYAMRTTGTTVIDDRCTEPGRIVDGEIGPYEPSWGSFLDAPLLIGLHGLRDVWLPHGYPVNSTTGCDDTYDERRPFEGLAVRRFARDVVVLHGPVRADVRAVTVRSSTGQPNHAAVGGGAFLASARTTNSLGETLDVTAHLADGRTTTQTVYVGDYETKTRWAQYAPLPDGSGVRIAWIAGNSDEPFVGVDVERRGGRVLVAVRELAAPTFGPAGGGRLNFLQVDLRCVDLILDPADASAPLADASDGRARRRVALRDLQIPRYGAAPTTCLTLRPGERLPVRSWLAEELKGF